jgi:hypothetical protein
LARIIFRLTSAGKENLTMTEIKQLQMNNIEFERLRNGVQTAFIASTRDELETGDFVKISSLTSAHEMAIQISHVFHLPHSSHFVMVSFETMSMTKHKRTKLQLDKALEIIQMVSRSKIKAEKFLKEVQNANI